MSTPPKTPPSSDIDGGDRSGRAGTPSKSHPTPGKALDDAKRESIGRPKPSHD